jgi:hypothetical protein
MEMFMIYEWNAERFAKMRNRKIYPSVTLVAAASPALLLFR